MKIPLAISYKVKDGSMHNSAVYIGQEEGETLKLQYSRRFYCILWYYAFLPIISYENILLWLALLLSSLSLSMSVCIYSLLLHVYVYLEETNGSSRNNLNGDVTAEDGGRDRE